QEQSQESGARATKNKKNSSKEKRLEPRIIINPR
ncbi:hypothetical protein A2U01_0093506, partial [Trifolium medium]|nr:hypothetical protein [Trifolium medium]